MPLTALDEFGLSWGHTDIFLKNDKGRKTVFENTSVYVDWASVTARPRMFEEEREHVDHKKQQQNAEIIHRQRLKHDEATVITHL